MMIAAAQCRTAQCNMERQCTWLDRKMTISCSRRRLDSSSGTHGSKLPQRLSSSKAQRQQVTKMAARIPIFSSTATPSQLSTGGRTTVQSHADLMSSATLPLLSCSRCERCAAVLGHMRVFTDSFASFAEERTMST
jgi:hypothetical protein